MSEEDKQMMARISQLAGQINRHKNLQHGAITTHQSAQHRYSPYHGRGGPYSTSRSSTASRHRTLVLNSPTTPGTPQNGSSTPSAPSPSVSGANNTRSGTESGSSSDTNTWVQRNDRHRQLISSDVYEKDKQTRANAMAESLRLKQQAKSAHEQSVLAQQFLRTAVPVAGATSGTPSSYEVLVEGIPFSVTKNGSKLLKVPGRITSGNPTPKMAIIAGVKFYRSKNGNLYRNGIAKAQRHSSAKINQQCKLFSTTGISLPRSRMYTHRRHQSSSSMTREMGAGPDATLGFSLGLGCQPRGLRPPARRASISADLGILRYVCRSTPLTTSRVSFIGSCPLGPRCRYIHDAAKVAICKDFLKGSCVFGDHCDLSHDPTPQRTPTCLHYTRGNCTNSKCLYAHSSVPATAPLCRDFGYLGYCDKGAECGERHVLFQCPDFTNSGKCNNRGCKLLHRERASVLRKLAAGADGDDSMEDVSSDEEVFDSDDIDSDAADEYISASSTAGADFSTQNDFIAF